MKKLFAGIVAALALVPVIASAASYTAGDYVNFAGNDSDWTSFNATGSAEEIQSFLDNSGISTYFISETANKDSKGNTYLKVLQVAHSRGEAALSSIEAANNFAASEAYTNTVNELDAAITVEYGRTENGAVSVADFADIEAVLGITGTTIPVNAKNTKILNAITVSADEANKSVVYVFTKTAGTEPGTYKAVKVTRANGNVTAYELVEVNPEDDTTVDWLYLFTTLEMNEAYVCKASTADTYSCYECPTGEENKSDFVWRRDGAQAADCKKVEKITSKAKCVKSPKTGVDSYLIPSAIVLGVCAIVLTVLKRKDAFRTI